MARVGVLLSGCGVKDGSEIHEAVLTLLALDEAGAEAVCLAPDKPQWRAVDHRDGKKMADTRNMLAEAARIARGKISAVELVDPAALDALIIVGGFGAALNLCDFAEKGKECKVDAEVARLIRALHQVGKPIGALCISPVILAAVLGGQKPRLTIGTDKETAAGLEALGAKHVDCPVDDVVIDRDHKLVSTPAYMLAGHIAALKTGINKAVAAVLEMIPRG